MPSEKEVEGTVNQATGPSDPRSDSPRHMRFDRDYLRAEATKLKQRAASRKSAAKEFASVEHLNPEAVAAFVDNELSPMAAHRARIHMVQCEECREEVARQRVASERLRSATCREVHASSDLVAKLTQIAQSCPTGPSAEELEEKSKSFLAKLDAMTRTKPKARGKKKKHGK